MWMLEREKIVFYFRLNSPKVRNPKKTYEKWHRCALPTGLFVCLWDYFKVQLSHQCALPRLPQGTAFRKMFYAAGAVTVYMR